MLYNTIDEEYNQEQFDYYNIYLEDQVDININM